MRSDSQTHPCIHPQLVGVPLSITHNKSSVLLETTQKMVADEKGLVHGGFIFSLADYAAMLAVNHPLVVLASASVSFLRPVKEGDKIIASAKITESKGKKRVVSVEVAREEDLVFNGEFLCIIPDRHVLE